MSSLLFSSEGTGLQLILSDIWDAVARVVLLSSPPPIIPSPWTLAATDPAANTHTHSVIVPPDGQCQMTWPLELVTLRHNHYEDDGTQTQNAQIRAACPCEMEKKEWKSCKDPVPLGNILSGLQEKKKQAHNDALEVNSSVFETKINDSWRECKVRGDRRGKCEQWCQTSEHWSSDGCCRLTNRALRWKERRCFMLAVPGPVPASVSLCHRDKWLSHLIFICVYDREKHSRGSHSCTHTHTYTVYTVYILNYVYTQSALLPISHWQFTDDIMTLQV